VLFSGQGVGTTPGSVTGDVDAPLGAATSSIGAASYPPPHEPIKRRRAEFARELGRIHADMEPVDEASLGSFVAS
jgi:hypothetical protein